MRPGRNATDSVAWLLQHRRCFIQDRFHEKLGPSGALLEKMFSRFMEGRAPTEFTLKEKTEFIVQGVLSGKIFDCKAREHLPVERTFRLFRAARGEGKTCRANGQGQRTGAAHISNGEHGCRTTRVSILQQIYSATQQRQHGGERAGSQRDRADPRNSTPYIYGFHSQAPSRKWLGIFSKS